MKKEFINQVYETKQVGMGASGTYWTDFTPFEVVRIVSDKTIDIRQLDVEIIGGDWLDPEYKLYSNDEHKVIRVRRTKRGWRTADGMKIYFGNALYYRDPSF